jgi:hypothetical protein
MNIAIDVSLCVHDAALCNSAKMHFRPEKSSSVMRVQFYERLGMGNEILQGMMGSASN